MSTQPPQRAPGSFSPLLVQPSPSRSAVSSPARPAIRRVDTSSEEEGPLIKSRRQRQTQTQPLPQDAPAAPRPFYAQSTSSSSSSLQNFSRPSGSASVLRSETPLRNAASYWSLADSSERPQPHRRKHSQTQGSFEPYLPTAAISNLAMASGLTASQIAAQAAMQSTHARQRSQTVPTHQDHGEGNIGGRKASRGGPASPPLLSLTEASGPRETSFGMLGGHSSAAHAAANSVFARSGGSSPILPPPDFEQRMLSDKPVKSEKSKVKLFSRPAKLGIGKEKDIRNGGQPSPSATSMSSATSMYSMANSSSTTIRQTDAPAEKEKDKEKHKHHFLSRQKHKLSSKDDHHLPLSSAASNSKPVDPSAPTSLYNFNLPPSPGPTTTSFAKSMSGLDLRHGGRALREKKKEEKSESALRESELSYNDWPGPSSLGSAGAPSLLGSTNGSYASSVYGSAYAGNETPLDSSKFGLNGMGPDDAWPYLRAKILNIFEGEELKVCVEDFNRLVTAHMNRCFQKRAPHVIVEDLRDLLATGFSSLDQTLRGYPNEQLIGQLVDMWLFTFTIILPYMQAVFLPLDLEFSGHGPIMSPPQAREFWGALPSSTTLADGGEVSATQVLEVRKIVLLSYRDTVILPRFDTLKTIFSRLSLDSISLILPLDVRPQSPDNRPSTAMSLDPGHASYSSQNTTLLGETSSESRSRAISNVSEPSGYSVAASRHSKHVEDSSKQLTETVGRMLQCMSVLTSVGVGAGGGWAGGLGGNMGARDEQMMMEELTRGLKLNWLGRGRTGRNRRGLVGARMPRAGAVTSFL